MIASHLLRPNKTPKIIPGQYILEVMTVSFVWYCANVLSLI